MIDLDAAMAQQGPRVAAWDRSPEREGALTIVVLGPQTGAVLAREMVSTAERAPLSQRLRVDRTLPGPPRIPASVGPRRRLSPPRQNYRCQRAQRSALYSV